MSYIIILAALGPTEPVSATCEIVRNEWSVSRLVDNLSYRWAWNIANDPNYPEFQADGPTVFLRWGTTPSA